MECGKWETLADDAVLFRDFRSLPENAWETFHLQFRERVNNRRGNDVDDAFLLSWAVYKLVQEKYVNEIGARSEVLRQQVFSSLDFRPNRKGFRQHTPC